MSDNKNVTVEGKLVRIRKDKTAICIIDGSQEENPIMGTTYFKEFWIPIQFIMDSSPDVKDMDLGDEIELEIPEWFALQKGLI